MTDTFFVDLLTLNSTLSGWFRNFYKPNILSSIFVLDWNRTPGLSNTNGHSDQSQQDTWQYSSKTNFTHHSLLTYIQCKIFHPRWSDSLFHAFFHHKNCIFSSFFRALKERRSRRTWPHLSRNKACDNKRHVRKLNCANNITLCGKNSTAHFGAFSHIIIFMCNFKVFLI